MATTDVSASPLQRTLMGRAALLFFLGMLTGIWVAVVFTRGKALGLELAPRQFDRLALAAHINGLLGCFWLLGLSYTLPHVAERRRNLLVLLTTIATFTNWAGTLLGSFIDRRGLDFGGDGKNKLIAGILQGGVVIPTLVASALWAFALLSRDRS